MSVADRNQIATRVVETLDSIAQVNPDLTLTELVEALELAKIKVVRALVREQLAAAHAQ